MLGRMTDRIDDQFLENLFGWKKMKNGSKQSNRELMPVVAKIIDEFTAVFGPGIKVLWAKEGGTELGTPLDRTKLVMPFMDEERSKSFNLNTKLPSKQIENVSKAAVKKRAKKLDDLEMMIQAGRIKLGA